MFHLFFIPICDVTFNVAFVSIGETGSKERHRSYIRHENPKESRHA